MLDETGRRPFQAVVVDARGTNEGDNLARAHPTLRRWRRSGLAVALVCSREGALTLPDHDLFEIVADDGRDRSPTMEGTVRLFGEATLRLDAAPTDTLVVAHEVAGVAAAQALGFRRIVGVERDGDAPHLVDAGATSVVADLRGLRFPRTLPAAFERLDELAERRGDRSLAVFLDYDGTITPIVAHPQDAHLSPEMRNIVAGLAQRFLVAIVSGRDRADVAARVGIESLYYAGSHGLDIAGPGISHTAPGAEAAARRLKAATGEIRQTVGDVAGVVIEPKRFSVAVHYRQVAADRSQAVIDAVCRAGDEWGLGVRRGKQVRELVPDLPWNKGRAVQWLEDTLGVDPANTCAIYIGDDETDEDAFQALGPTGIGLRPGSRVAASLADYHLTGVDEVRQFLQWLAAAPPSH